MREKRKKNDYGMVSVFRIVTVFGTYYSCTIVKALRIFTEKRMINDYWTEKVPKIVGAFRINTVLGW